MSDPRDIDEDAILKGLSPEELDQLEYELLEMDPEVWGGGGMSFESHDLIGVRPKVPTENKCVSLGSLNHAAKLFCSLNWGIVVV